MSIPDAFLFFWIVSVCFTSSSVGGSILSFALFFRLIICLCPSSCMVWKYSILPFFFHFCGHFLYVPFCFCRDLFGVCNNFLYFSGFFDKVVFLFLLAFSNCALLSLVLFLCSSCVFYFSYYFAAFFVKPGCSFPFLFVAYFCRCCLFDRCFNLPVVHRNTFLFKLFLIVKNMIEKMG